MQVFFLEVIIVLKLIRDYAMKTQGIRGIAPPFLILALDGGQWSVSCPGRFTPG
jgi:hypothetical protein